MLENKEDSPPWTQQKGEHSKSFFFFTVYRDLGPSRTIEKVIEKVRDEQRKTEDEEAYPIPTMSSLVQLSASKRWVERCRAWDEHLDKVARTNQELKVKEMVERHAEDSKNLQEKILEVIDDPEFKDQPLTKKAWILNTTVHSHYKETSLERLSRGQSNESEEDEENKTNQTVEEVEDLFKEAERGNDKK